MLCKKCKKEIPAESAYCMYCGTPQATQAPKVRTRGNGQGSAFKLPNGKWRAQVSFVSGMEKKVSKTKSGFKTKKEALAYIPKLLNAPLSHEITLAKVYDDWSRTHYEGLSHSKTQSYEIAWKRCKTIQHRNMSTLKLVDLQQVVDAEASTYYTRKDMKMLLSQVFRYAMQNDYVTKNYAEFIGLPAFEKPNKDAFSDDEIDKFWEDYSAGNKFTGYILVMIYTGMRYGEISTVLKENIHLSEQYMIGGIKSVAGKNRIIAIKDSILSIVTEIYGQCNKVLLEISEDDFYGLFKGTLARLGVRPLTPHCCRHTFATLMANANIAPAIIKEAAGHKNYSTTLDYTHIKLRELLNAVNKL